MFATTTTIQSKRVLQPQRSCPMPSWTMAEHAGRVNADDQAPGATG
jgi:hypothetical protein